MTHGTMIIRSIDLETTGIPKEGEPLPGICEIGWCDVVPIDGSVMGRRSALCDPGRPIPPEARATHHISDKDVSGLASPDVVFQAAMDPTPDCLCAHNADFERAFLPANLSIPIICTYKVALRIWPDAPSHSLQVLRYWLDLEMDQSLGLPAHRAGPDAYVGAVLMARILKEPGAPDLPTMVRWSSGPALMARIGFGKHRGEKWSDVPADYLRWIIDKSDLDRDAKANAKHWLKQRDAL